MMAVMSWLRRNPAVVVVPAYVLTLVVVIFSMRRFASFQENDYLYDLGRLHWYEPANATLPPATPDRMVFMGDSITYGWKRGDPALFDGDRIDRGIPGQTTKDILLRFRQDVVDLHPRTVHLLCGVNDFLGLSGPMTSQQTENDIATLVDIAEANHIQVILGTLLPSRTNPYIVGLNLTPQILEVNTWIRAYAAERHLLLIDYYPALAEPDGAFNKAYTIDGLHPSPAGYAVMSRLLERTLAASDSTGAGEGQPAR